MIRASIFGALLALVVVSTALAYRYYVVGPGDYVNVNQIRLACKFKGTPGVDLKFFCTDIRTSVKHPLSVSITKRYITVIRNGRAVFRRRR